MKRAVLILGITLAGVLSYLMVDAFILAPPEAPPTASERFPIVTRFDLPHDYGYFIGDEIPLTLIVEASNQVVLDLVNLPRQGEQHGLLEIRDFTLRTSAAAEKRIYRATYSLQYFGAAPLSIQFEPLEILYAATDSRDDASQPYRYNSLFTQPLTINISRIGPYQPTPALDPKGPLPDQRRAWLWISGIFGVLCIVAAVGGWGREWWCRRQQQNVGSAPPTAVAKTLQRLRQRDDQVALAKAPQPAPRTRLGDIVREYLQEACGVSAYTLTPAELAARLDGTPAHVQDILALLQRCDTVKYQPVATVEGEEHFLWEEAVTLFEQLDAR